MVRTSRALAVVSIAAACASCIAVFDLEELSEKPTPPEEAGAVDATPEASCAPDNVGLAGRPEPADGDAGTTALFVVDDIDFGIDASTEGVGFDLDSFSTTEVANNACVVGAPSGTQVRQEATIPDLAGIDTAMGRLLRQVEEQNLGNFGPTSLGRRLKQGRYGIAFILEGWNGAAEDDDVRVIALPLIGYGRFEEAGFVWGSRLKDGGFSPQEETGESPRLDAGDVWQPHGSYLRARGPGSSLGERALFASAAAWVVNGRLVARFDAVTLAVRFDDKDPLSVDLKMREAWLSAAVATDGTSLRDGVLGGRVDVETLLDQLASLRVERFGPYLCSFSPAYDALQRGACASRDIRSSHCEDRQARPCDALSLGVRFTAVSVSELGPDRVRTQDEYANAGLLLPDLRCPNQPEPRCP